MGTEGRLLFCLGAFKILKGFCRRFDKARAECRVVAFFGQHISLFVPTGLASQGNAGPKGYRLARFEVLGFDWGLEF